jgi:hypothetical protein
MTDKQCSKCGAEFGCANPVAGCWCEQFSVPAEQLAHLRSNFADCLCPGCLAGYAADKPQNESIALNKE